MSTTTQKEYTDVISGCKGLFAQKQEDYDSAWRILRLPSFTDQIMIKAKRIRTIQEKQQRVADGIEVELMGIVNYGILALIQIDLVGDQRLHIPHDEVLCFYDGVVKRIVMLLGKKNHDYDDVWRDMRVGSMVDIILMKLLRIKKIEDKGYTTISEGVGAGYQDIVNYAVFSLIQLKSS